MQLVPLLLVALAGPCGRAAAQWGMGIWDYPLSPYEAAVMYPDLMAKALGAKPATTEAKIETTATAKPVTSETNETTVAAKLATGEPRNETAGTVEPTTSEPKNETTAAVEPFINNSSAEFTSDSDEILASAPPCSGHGSLSCDCERGYEGVNCDEEIDWCARSQAAFQGDFNNSALCGAFGICVSEVAKGASCICHSGYSGPFCATLPADSTVARRCVQPEIPIEADSNRVHCAEDERCLLDDLDCAHSRNAKVVKWCRNQKGYCLPDAKVKAILEQRQRQKERQIKCAAAANTYKSSVASATKCVNGQGTCTCDPGYEGDNCGQEVDYCSQPCPALDGGEMGDICGPHGTCRSSHGGIACICQDGFIGTYCNRAPDVVIEPKRCVPKDVPTRENETIHCAEHEHCFPDNVRCNLGDNTEVCEYPIGWCLPIAQPTTPTQAPDTSSSALPFATTQVPSVSVDNCSVRIEAAVNETMAELLAEEAEREREREEKERKEQQKRDAIKIKELQQKIREEEERIEREEKELEEKLRREKEEREEREREERERQRQLDETKEKRCGEATCKIKNSVCCPVLNNGTMTEGCCPFENGVCCPDLTHCCPSGEMCAPGEYCRIPGVGDDPSSWYD